MERRTVTAIPVKQSRFTSGDLSTGQLTLTRTDDTTAECGVLIFLGALTDNGDGTFDVTFA